MTRRAFEAAAWALDGLALGSMALLPLLLGVVILPGASILSLIGVAVAVVAALKCSAAGLRWWAGRNTLRT
ncbi:MAG: hypothetical protein AAFQ51_14180 [Pseudomonadota bacterium]